MSTAELSEILQTVESLRLEMQPHLPKGFLEAIVMAEEANPEDDVRAIAAIRAEVEAILAEMERT